MNIESKVTAIADEISAQKFRYTYSEREYKWLAGKCNELINLLKESKADPALVGQLVSICADLECQQLNTMHDLLRQQTLIFNQDAILFYLMKEGYLKLLRF